MLAIDVSINGITSFVQMMLSFVQVHLNCSTLPGEIPVGIGFRGFLSSKNRSRIDINLDVFGTIGRQEDGKEWRKSQMAKV